MATMDAQRLANRFDALTGVRCDWATTTNEAALAAWEHWLAQCETDYDTVREAVGERFSAERPTAVSECGGGSSAVYWYTMPDGRLLGLGTPDHFAYDVPSDVGEPAFPKILWREQ